MSHAPQTDGDDDGLRPTDRLAILVIAGLVVAVSVAAIVTALGFPATRLATDVGPARFPIVYAIALIGLSAVLAINTLRAPSAPPQQVPAADRPSYGAVAAGIVATAICIFAMDYLGFLVTMAVYLFGLMRLMGRRTLLWNAVIAAGLTAVIYVAFLHGLNVPLPEGSLFE
ncbi:tripartite tricarboxylate transporter TctB family protein [Azospirillum sp. ST 5-10]|uniref:tripartite tricarboxylate transporter TctB family protein n=1 Tax=unclassified Azospirillum TaxID=2630922 RepID=UPI003F4A1034